MEVMDLIAEYIIAFYQAKNELFPYWVWGWNYLCPNRDGYQISLLSYTQFFRSLRSLGYPFETNTMYGLEEREKEILSSFDGYQKVVAFLRSLDRCEPKWDRAPYQPKLCRRWWEPAHQQSCGAVTQEALDRAFQIDEAYATRAKASKEARQPAHPSPEQRTIMASLRRWLTRK